MVKKILLVDDDPGFRDLLKPLLEAKEFYVCEAETGFEANAAIASQKFDLLIIDEILPDIRGTKVIAGMRPEVVTSVIFISALRPDSKHLSELLQNSQVKLIVQKPLLPLVLVDQIDNIFKASETQNELGDKSKLSKLLPLLQEKYKKEIPSLIDELLASISEAGKNQDDETRLTQAIRKAHSLSGTSGTYGYQELSRVVMNLEKSLNAICEQQENRSLLWCQLEGDLEALRLRFCQDCFEEPSKGNEGD
jgi:DNA-binding response OmpR family regulator